MAKKICTTRNAKHNTTYTYCISDIPDEIKIEDPPEIIGVGSYGVVIGAKMEKIPIAIKIIPLNVSIPSYNCGLKTDDDCSEFTVKQFKKEVKFSRLFGDLEVSPKVFFAEILPTTDFYGPDNKNALDRPEIIGVIVMERFGTSLSNINKHYLIENNEKIRDQLHKLLSVLFDFGFEHPDLHLGNIVADTKTNQVRIIDLDDLEPIDNTLKYERETFDEYWNWLISNVKNSL